MLLTRLGLLSLPLKLQRNINSTLKVYQRCSYSTAKLDVKEISLKVPWGHVSGRHWNGSDPSRKPVICLHGWKDNAATWDTLLPLLVNELPDCQFYAIDLPGHGISSHLPMGMLYDFKFCVLVVKRIMNINGWKTASILGHSFGAQLGFLFAGSHPDLIENYIAIDAIAPLIMPRNDVLDMIPTVTQQYLDFEAKIKRNRPSYTYEEILNRIYDTNLGGMNHDCCKILMSRGVKETSPGSGQFQFTHDPRVQYMPLSFLSHRQISYVAKNFQSRVMFINASGGLKYMTPYLMANIEKWLRKNNKKSVRFVDVDGSHHCHLTSPEGVFPYVFQILIKKNKSEST